MNRQYPNEKHKLPLSLSTKKKKSKYTNARNDLFFSLKKLPFLIIKTKFRFVETEKKNCQNDREYEMFKKLNVNY